MRWIFLFMLAANIAYLGWELNQPAAHRPRAAHSDANVPKIVLLRELSDAASEAADVAEKAPAETAEEQTANNDTPTVQPEVQSQPKETTPEKIPDTAEAETQKPTAAAEVATPPDKLPESNTTAVARFACYTLGPFREIADLRKLIRDIREFVVEASFRSREEREQSMYWVYLPPEKSREAANALGAELKRKNIRDYYVVNSGEQVNAISLGHFREKAGALSLAQKVKRAGFTAQIDPVFKSYTIYWLDYQLQTDRAIPVSALDLSRLPNISRFDRNCE
jgi:cell division septation protein DedD